eukprot:2214214-Pleurochrysis_carterae.AAC.1
MERDGASSSEIGRDWLLDAPLGSINARAQQLSIAHASMHGSKYLRKSRNKFQVRRGEFMDQLPRKSGVLYKLAGYPYGRQHERPVLPV